MPQSIELDRRLVISLYQTPLSTLDVAKKMGVCAELIRQRLQDWGVPRHPAKNLPRPQPNKSRKMEANGAWRGGEILDKDGYVLVKMNDHPAANSGGYVRKHRLVMEKKLGRPLSPDEVVHHRDDNRQNNRSGNLRLFEKNSDHLQKTLRGKCPKWSAAGRKNTLRGHRSWCKKAAAIRALLEIYAKSQGTTWSHLADRLTSAGRLLLRTALTRGESVPLPELVKEHGRPSRSELYRQRKKMSRQLDQKS